MAAKVPDNITNGSLQRIVLGSKSLYILEFLTEDLDDTDTVDCSSFLSVVEAAWAQCTTKSQTSDIGIALSGTGNTTLTFGLAVDNLKYRVFVIGTP